MMTSTILLFVTSSDFVETNKIYNMSAKPELTSGSIVCVSCGALLSDLYAVYDQCVAAGEDRKVVLDRLLGTRSRVCCRTQFLTRGEWNSAHLKYTFCPIDAELEKRRACTIFYAK